MNLLSSWCFKLWHYLLGCSKIPTSSSHTMIHFLGFYKNILQQPNPHPQITRNSPVVNTQIVGCVLKLNTHNTFLVSLACLVKKHAVSDIQQIRPTMKLNTTVPISAAPLKYSFELGGSFSSSSSWQAITATYATQESSMTETAGTDNSWSTWNVQGRQNPVLMPACPKTSEQTHFETKFEKKKVRNRLLQNHRTLINCKPVRIRGVDNLKRRCSKMS